jgi:hypothetical protein
LGLSKLWSISLFIIVLFREHLPIFKLKLIHLF